MIDVTLCVSVGRGTVKTVGEGDDGDRKDVADDEY